MLRPRFARVSRPAPSPLQAALSSARAAIGAAAKTDGPVLAGPFHAEVGYELLYWIPFLRWAVSTEPRLAGRLVAVSRGGTASWYDGVATGYVELYDLVAAAELETSRAAVEEETRGSRKQLVESSLDLRLRNLADERIQSTATIHPSLLFEIIRQLVRRPLPRGKDLPLAFAPLARSSVPLDLPPHYVAVRFYVRPSFPLSNENIALVQDIVRRLAATSEVVVLDPDGRYDDHVDFPIVAGPGVHSLAGLVPDSENLAMQAAVVSGADAFVGTYGGLAYLPAFLGVPGLSLYSTTNFLPQHLELAGRVFAEPPYGRFVAVDTRTLDLLRLVLPAS
jgi:hypothetical protein